MTPGSIQIVEGDLTRLVVDAIVNAANASLLGGGGVDGAIHRAAGPQLLEECRRIGGCPTGEASIAKGWNLPAKWIIHTVGPVWLDGRQGEDGLLANCYRNSLAVAEQNFFRTIAFPAINTGAYGFPIDRATGIAVTEAARFFAKKTCVEKITFVCFGPEVLHFYFDALRAATP